MATAVTVANFQLAIGTCYDYVEAGDWTNAQKYYAKAAIMNAGLELEVADEGAKVTRRQSLKDIKDAIDAAQQASAAADSESRFIRTQTAFGGKF